MSKDWVRWHGQYERDTPLRQRLAIVQRLIGDVLAASGEAPLRAISVCSGDGRDLLGVLAQSPGRGRVRARSVELDARLAAAAEAAATAAGIDGVEVVIADAGDTAAYRGATPADLVLLCGVFGNIVDGDVKRTIRLVPMLCAANATVIWTRHRREPDLTPAIRGWFRDAGFEEVAFETVPSTAASVGAADSSARRQRSGKAFACSPSWRRPTAARPGRTRDHRPGRTGVRRAGQVGPRHETSEAHGVRRDALAAGLLVA